MYSCGMPGRDYLGRAPTIVLSPCQMLRESVPGDAVARPGAPHTTGYPFLLIRILCPDKIWTDLPSRYYVEWWELIGGYKNAYMARQNF